MRFLRSLPLIFLWIHLTIVAQPPPGYYSSATGLTGTAMQSALHVIIKNHHAVSYTPGVWNAFYTTDLKANGKVWDMYSDIPGGTPPYEYTPGSDQCGIATQEGDCYSREHSWPKSWFNDLAPMVTDLFHIYPTDQYVNNRHSNYPYGEVANPTWTSLNNSRLGPCVTPGYAGTVFEPRDEYKGDFARSYFYMSTRYYTEDAGWTGSPMVTGSQLNPWALTMMIRWDSLDPVSPKEISRNNAIYAIQLNRNPFIDHPEYVNAIWGPGSNIKPEPSNYPANFSAHTIHLRWADATGTFLPDAYLIRMSMSGFDSIYAPIDGTIVPDDGFNLNVPYGVQEAWFGNLVPDTPYFFRIYGYVFSGANGIDYKTDGIIPQVQQKTQR